MALPINIKELLNGKTVEWERIEFREGWDPGRTLRTICAFANDFNNWGGGYIILGVAENDGQPVLPPAGLQLNQIDPIQQELNQICRRISPNYFPIVEPVDYQNKKLLILWCPGGSNRPYKSPESLGQNPRYFQYIRRYSSTVQPTRDEERELLSMANQIPFDDQVNQNKRLTDFDLSAIKIYLNDVGSDLENEIGNLHINDITRRMNIAEGSDENLLPKNVGLLFFAKHPQEIFPSAKIEIVTFQDEAGSNYTEKIFTGGLHRQLKGALDYLKDVVIKENIVKSPAKAEANRNFNYPYDALEEALCNAVYHRGYDFDSTIEVRIYPSKIDIISFPGPLPPLNKEKLKNNQFDVRKYRNRRIGEFLKELRLTEGRATGIPTILNSLKKNGSPKPVFETDNDRTYFKTSIKVHPEFLPIKDQVGTRLGLSWDQVGTKSELSRDEVEKLIEICVEPAKIKEIMKEFEWSNRTKFKNKYINPLLDLDILEMTLPDKPNSPNQKYRITEKGKKLLEASE